MKIPPFLRISLAAALLATSTSNATDFTLNMTSVYSWGAAPWKDADGNSGSVPGAGDQIVDVTTDATSRDLYLNGDRTITSLIRASSGSTIRLYNGASGSGVDSTFTLTDKLEFQINSIAIRSNTAGGRLTINTKAFILGNNTTGARAQFGADTNANYQNITFNAITTRLSGSNSAIEMLLELSAVNTHLNFGHLTFDDTLSGGSPGLGIGSGKAEVSSLNSSGAGGGTIRGAGTLVISGSAGDPNQPSAIASFSNLISGAVKLEKTGSNIQILTGTGSNSYTGGTLIAGGVLAVRGTTNISLLAAGPIEVASGGTLAGNSAISPGSGKQVVVKSGGSIAPGADQQGFNTLVFNGFSKSSDIDPTLLKMESGASFKFNIDAAGNSDQILMAYYRSGALNIDAPTIAINVEGDLDPSKVYTLFTFKDSGVISGKPIASGISDKFVAGSGFDGFTATFHYDEVGYGGVGTISLTVAAIPETRVGALLPFGLGLLMLLKKGQLFHARKPSNA